MPSRLGAKTLTRVRLVGVLFKVGYYSSRRVFHRPSTCETRDNQSIFGVKPITPFNPHRPILRISMCSNSPLIGRSHPRYRWHMWYVATPSRALYKPHSTIVGFNYVARIRSTNAPVYMMGCPPSCSHGMPMVEPPRSKNGGRLAEYCGGWVSQSSRKRSKHPV